MTVVEDDTVQEMYDLTIPRVDAVDGPAHHRPFLLLKAEGAGPLMELDRVLKAKYTAEQQRKMLAAGHAMKGPDGEPSYPVGDKDDLDRGIHTVGRGGADHDKIRRYLMRMADVLNAKDMIPDNWAADGSITEASVSKAMDDDPLDGLTPDDGLIGSGDVVEDAAGIVAPTHEGDPDDPASPAWEAVDAARARAAVEKVTWLKGLVGDMRDREAAEAVTGEPGDAASAMDLDCVLDALDCALATLAKFAVDEQAEADDRAQDIADQAEALGITKSATVPDLAQVTQAIADATAVIKAGRVLSAANEASLRAAHSALTEVLGRVPSPEPTPEEAAVTAPTEAVEKSATTEPEPVEKAQEATQAEPTAEAASPAVEPVAKAADDPADAPVEPVEKAGMTPDDFRALAGKFLKAIPDGKINAAFQELAKLATPDDGSSDTPAAAENAAAAPEAPAEAVPAEQDTEKAAAPESPVTPASPPPAAESPTHGTPVMEPAAPEPDTDEPVTKAGTAQDAAILDAITRALTAVEERVTKAITPLTDHAAALEARLAVVEAQPAPGGPMLNGAVPAGSEPGGLEAVHKAIREIADPATRRAAQGAAVHEILLGLQRGEIGTIPAR